MASVIKIKFGSHLYGTSTPASDLDIKGVFLPPARDILLQRSQAHESERRAKHPDEKNTADDVDYEAFALHRYLALVAEGQTMAIDMLFAPESAWLGPPASLWRDILRNRHRLVSRQANKFVTYCYDQAQKYGIKGSRVHAVRSVLAWFDEAIAAHGAKARLGRGSESLHAFISEHGVQHTQIVDILHKVRKVNEPHLECCGLKAPFAVRLDEARAIYQRLMDRYGARSFMAEANQNVDWKAMSHGVRVAQEAIQLLRTGWIEFPRPEAAHLLDIKLGRLPYAAVATEIEGLLERVQEEQARSSLPEQPDMGYIDELVCEGYGRQVRAFLAAEVQDAPPAPAEPSAALPSMRSPEGNTGSATGFGIPSG